VSKNPWPFRLSDIRRGIRAVESAGKIASSVKIGYGWFEVLIGGHEERFDLGETSETLRKLISDD
jgi:hypothetical protein